MSAAAPRLNPWALHASLLRQPWQARRNRRSWLSLSLVPVLAVGVALALSTALRLKAGGVLMMGGLVLLVILWHLQVDGLLRQNRHVLARLVPGHAQALQLSLLVQGLAFTAVAVLLISLGSSPQLRWLWLCLMVVVMLAWLVREPLGWIAFGLLSPLLGELPRWTQQLAGLPWGAQLLGLGSLVLLLAACAGQGGAWHLWFDGRHRRLQRSIDALSRGETVAAVDQGRLGRAVTRCFDWPQRVWRRRVIAAGPRLPMGTRLGVALGTGGAMPALLWLGVCIFAVLGLMLWARQVSWSMLAEPGRLGICIGLFSMLAGVLNGRLERLWARRREQALMLLLPGCPRGPGMAGLEQRWRAQAVLLWAGLTALALALTHQGGAASRDFVLFVALLCLPLPWLAQWRARRLQAKPSPWVFGPWPALAGLAGVGAVHLGLTAAWSLGAALAVAVGAELCVRRDRRPPLPLPAGRAG
ncbi:hypothetical protein [Rubrivivax rivuli]|uniref:Uncharacterized protein n=1 Tax=Rubrivivax rivuli TaxID=1862385 RepID=A0A437R9C5_9BURK|nr:hypothetical protein [Rubrivivax rivuli]RVU43307.1 hypothetical protein EOE66_20380 [Rubrivivax rivuli]